MTHLFNIDKFRSNSRNDFTSPAGTDKTFKKIVNSIDLREKVDQK